MTPSPLPAGQQKDYRSTGELMAHLSCYLFTFIGIGLAASSIIKYPTDPPKFLTIGIVGLSLFFISSALEEMIIARQKLFQHGVWKRVFGTFIFSAGIAMINASIQDFEHIPYRTVFTLPVAVFAACGGFLLRKLDEHDPKKIAYLLLFGLCVALGSWLVVYGLIHF